MFSPTRSIGTPRGKIDPSFKPSSFPPGRQDFPSLFWTQKRTIFSFFQTLTHDLQTSCRPIAVVSQHTDSLPRRRTTTRAAAAAEGGGEGFPARVRVCVCFLAFRPPLVNRVRREVPWCAVGRADNLFWKRAAFSGSPPLLLSFSFNACCTEWSECSQKVKNHYLSKGTAPKPGKMERREYVRLVVWCIGHQSKIFPWQTSVWFERSLFRHKNHFWQKNIKLWKKSKGSKPIFCYGFEAFQ